MLDPEEYQLFLRQIFSEGKISSVFILNSGTWDIDRIPPESYFHFRRRCRVLNVLIADAIDLQLVTPEYGMSLLSIIQSILNYTNCLSESDRPIDLELEYRIKMMQ